MAGAAQSPLPFQAHHPHLVAAAFIIPKELEECARIAGATRFGAMVRTIFPVTLPGILEAGIFAFTLSWNEFIYALIFMSSAELKTVPVGVVSACRSAWCRCAGWRVGRRGVGMVS